MRDFSALRSPVETRSVGHARARPYNSHKPNGRRELLAAICIVVFFTLCGMVYFAADMLRTDRVSANVILDCKPIGGMTRQQLSDMFAYLRTSSPSDLQVTIDGRTWQVPAGSIGARYGVDEMIDKAMLAGHSGSLPDRIGDIFSMRGEPLQLFFHRVYDEKKLAEVAMQIAIEASVPAVDATMRFSPDSEEPFQYTEGAPGRAVSVDGLKQAMEQSLAMRVSAPVIVDSSPVAPAVTVETLKARTQLLGSFTTVLTDDAMRNNNIKLACKAVNGVTLQSGEVFSFNALTGERTAGKGYVDAPALSNGKLVDETGGGVCQVSTTVYNAALAAGLTVVERHAHSRPMTYVDPGRDATVDFDSGKDLRLENASPLAVYVIVRADEAQRLLTAEIYGAPSQDTISVVEEDYRLLMPEKPVEITNAKKPIGWSNTIVEARSGCSVSVYRIFSSGADVRKELVSNDLYLPQRGKIEIGTRVPAGEMK